MSKNTATATVDEDTPDTQSTTSVATQIYHKRYIPSINITTTRTKKPYAESAAVIAKKATDEFLTGKRIADLNMKQLDPSVVHDALLSMINEAINAQNAQIKTDKNKTGTIIGNKINPLKRLGFAEVARLMLALHSVISLSPSSRNSDPDLNVLAAYDDDPASAGYGTYRASRGHLREIARRYSPDVTTKEFLEIEAALTDGAPRRTRGSDPDLIATKNCIVNYRDASRIEFSPDYVFLSKLDVDWDPDAPNPVIDTPDDDQWDVETWMKSLDDDPEVVDLFWQIIGAAVRPYVSWNKAAFFFSTQGNNGKGTLLALMRNILGVANYASIPLSDFGKDFLLEPLTRASAILVDENDVGSFVERSANFKAVITNDVITINRKYKAPIAHQHFGFMVQCLNDEPVIKDKSESFYRRQLFIKFTKCFTGAERKYIKDDYLQRPEVLRYVLKRVLTAGDKTGQTPSYYTLSEPQAVKDALDEFKENNDPTLAFWNDVKNQFTWDLLPFNFLYDLYIKWMNRFMPKSLPLGRNKFMAKILTMVNAEEDSQWIGNVNGTKNQHRPGSRMTAAEPLIIEYDLIENWGNPSAARSATGTKHRNAGIIPSDSLKDSYRGLLRKTPEVPTPPPAPTPETTEADTNPAITPAAPLIDIASLTPAPAAEPVVETAPAPTKKTAPKATKPTKAATKTPSPADHSVTQLTDRAVYDSPPNSDEDAAPQSMAAEAASDASRASTQKSYPPPEDPIPAPDDQ